MRPSGSSWSPPASNTLCVRCASPCRRPPVSSRRVLGRGYWSSSSEHISLHPTPSTEGHVRMGKPVNKGAQIVTLRHEARDMPGWQVRIELDNLTRSTAIFHNNYLELKRHVDFCETDPSNQDLWHMHSIEKQDRFATETWRLLHNFVSSAFSLVEHTRIVFRKLNRDGEFPDYQGRVDASFAKSPLAQFVQGLRNYLLHTGSGTLHFHGPIDVRTGHADIKMYLRKDDLMNWTGWNSTAKRFLADSDDMVHIGSVAREYHDQVRDFHLWFGERQREICRKELDEVRAKECEAWVLELEDRLDRFESAPGDPGSGETGLFIGLLDYSDYRELDTLPRDSEARAALALSKLRERVPLPSGLEKRIREAYSSGRLLPESH